jgi:hypothetical protein
MKLIKVLPLFVCFIFRLAVFAQSPAENYPVDPASVDQTGVPKGRYNGIYIRKLENISRHNA